MKESNELIARFMGGTKQIVGPEKLHGYKPGTVLWRDLFDDPGTVTYLLFHSDWDWLMPVIERIERLGYYTNIFKDEDIQQCAIFKPTFSYQRTGDDIIVANYPGKHKSKLDATYAAVVEFIQWYNTTKQQEQTPHPEQSNESSNPI